MAEEFNRNPSETTAYGYRQLPGSGPTRGLDMKTLTSGVIGVAMGIVVGTLAADGTLRSMIHGPALHSVQASIQTPKPPAPPAAKPAQVQTTPAAVTLAQTQATPPKSLAAVQETPKPLAGLKSTPTLTPILATPVVKVSAAGKTRPGHRLVSRRRHLGRRRVHSRHRAHFHLKARAIAKSPAKVKAAKPVLDADLFTFTVEGDVTVASYDVSLRQIDTYEGETFALNQIASLNDMIPFDAYPASLHYRCDQSWNCTLFRDGSTIISAKRTK
jgi:hypothetical protein